MEPVATGDDPTTQPDPAEGKPETADEPTGNAEAARYRRRLRDAEAERDTATAALDLARRQLVERAASEVTSARLGDPSDLWRAGAELADLVDEAGAADSEKVAATTARVIAEHPTWRAYSFPDLGQGARGPTSPGPVDLAAILRASAR
ncbi:MAG: hypothetical protein ACR2GF_02790 [Acidimicrobiales bacterium]